MGGVCEGALDISAGHINLLCINLNLLCILGHQSEFYAAEESQIFPCTGLLSEEPSIVVLLAIRRF
jgi:hypothetical protein